MPNNTAVLTILLYSEEPCSTDFVANVKRCASAMVSKARELQLPFKLQFAVGGPYEKLELTNRALTPMVEALKPLREYSDWLWDFHIDGQSRGLSWELHKQPQTRHNLTNAQYAQNLVENFTRWQAFFDLPSSGSFFRCGVFEQNGGTHDMGELLGLLLMSISCFTTYIVPSVWAVSLSYFIVRSCSRSRTRQC